MQIIDKGFKLTRQDFKIEYLRGHGHGDGGQKKQKTSSACRITHLETGYAKFCQDFREQHRNREAAFKRLCESKQFKAWCAKKLNDIETNFNIDNWIEEQMKEENLKVEYL